MNNNNSILVAGLIVALLLGLAAPFLASGDPDGLESAAEKIINEEVLGANLEEAGLEEEGTIAPSPMPDYAIPGMDKIGEIGALIIGILLITALSFGVGSIFKKSTSEN
ncbi:cobalt transport protein CbiM [Methanococcus maripaludis C5]|uniref:Cobalt transport protein CbiM n=1 Tax=Methanococcus maripaludis (strain C5 / ATCC BAA-1333) TaxID=402880 RepID=A4FXS3_METM5|nr:PDGLE domain-containing protein [Methanococcus maripaludis]ABO35007.1 cobalt transport protein CbiM [Methanococcus maripaludis C5]